MGAAHEEPPGHGVRMTGWARTATSTLLTATHLLVMLASLLPLLALFLVTLLLAASEDRRLPPLDELLGRHS